MLNSQISRRYEVAQYLSGQLVSRRIPVRVDPMSEAGRADLVVTGERTLPVVVEVKLGRGDLHFASIGRVAALADAFDAGERGVLITSQYVDPELLKMAVETGVHIWEVPDQLKSADLSVIAERLAIVASGAPIEWESAGPRLRSDTVRRPLRWSPEKPDTTPRPPQQRRLAEQARLVAEARSATNQPKLSRRWGSLAIPPRRLAGIEGLRAIAAMMVVLHHVTLYSTQDQHLTGVMSFFGDFALGVTLFFALSGFLLFQPFARAALTDRPAPRVGSYARNRAARILPAYWVVLILVSFVFAGATISAGVEGRMTSVRDLLATFTLTQNYWASTAGLGIGPAWALAVEATFYILLPIMGGVAIHFAKRAVTPRGAITAALAPALAMLVLGLSGKFVVHSGAADGVVGAIATTSLWVQADLFSFGMALAVLTVLVQSGRVVLPSRWQLYAAGTALVLAVPSLALRHQSLSSNPLNTLAGIVATIVLALVVLAPAGDRFVTLLERRPVVLAGLASYSVFLWNEPVIHWLQKHGLTLEHSSPLWLPVNLVIVTVVVGILSAATYRLVEKPALALRARRAHQAVPATQVEQPAP